jgi:cell division protein FtsQ
MWHRPGLLIATADLLFLAAAFLLAAVAALALARLPLFAIREVVFVTPPRETQRPEIERALREAIGGRGFWSVSTERVRQAVEQLPWIRRADVRRVWPDRLQVTIEEHRAIARWGAGNAQLLNDYGEVFYASASRPPRLELSGPLGTAAEVLARHREFGDLLTPLGAEIVRLELSPRLAWRIHLADGMAIEMGREQARAPLAGRLRRFVDAYRDRAPLAGRRATAVDLRYANGFAMRLADAGGSH